MPRAHELVTLLFRVVQPGGLVGFAQWNQRLLEYFFGDFAADQQVRLAVSRDLLDGEFADLGGWSSIFASRQFGREIVLGRLRIKLPSDDPRLRTA